MNVGKETEIREICEEVLNKIVPTAKERSEILKFTNDLNTRLMSVLQNAGITADIRIQGSIEKDTWLAGEKDIDVFIILPKGRREIFQKVLEVMKTEVEDHELAYAEHPYLKAKLEGYSIDFVPSFQIQNATEMCSSVDRTPLHTAYIKKMLNKEARNEVRLLKQFMRGIGIYGAEIKIQGFSGYLCELFILKYQSFIHTLKQFSEWQLSAIIDLENWYEGKYSEIQQRFNAPLIVIDPIDPHRNVAAAVSQENLGEFIMASRIFLEKPKLSFFFPPRVRRLSTSTLKQKLSNLGFDLVIILFQSDVTIPDILWGQLHKSIRRIQQLLAQSDFQVLNAKAWSDERGTNALLFGLESRYLPSVRKHIGPPTTSSEVVHFLAKYVKAQSTILGPWIEEDRWVVGVNRHYVDAVTLLIEQLLNSKELGIPKKFVNDVRMSFQIKVNEDIVEFCAQNEEFATFLTEFLLGRPKWLD